MPLRDINRVLFDIDGTLALGANSHHASMSRAARAHGFVITFAHRGESVTMNDRPVTGWLDAQIFRSCALPHELSDTHLASITQTYAEDFESLADLRGELVTGAAETLKRIAESPIDMALTTGNAHRIAQTKLASMRVEHYFEYAPHLGFGDRHANRIAMVRAALSNQHETTRTVVIGDTPYDMEAAVAVGAIGVGVLTGSGSASELQHAGASYVIPSVVDLLELIDTA